MRLVLGLIVLGCWAGQAQAQCPPTGSAAARAYSGLGPVMASATTDEDSSEARRASGLTLLGQPVTYAIRFKYKDNNRVYGLLYRLGNEVTPLNGALSEGARSQFKAMHGDWACRSEQLCIIHPESNDDLGMLYSTSLTAEGIGSWAGPRGVEIVRERDALNAVSQRPVYLVCTYNGLSD